MKGKITGKQFRGRGCKWGVPDNGGGIGTIVSIAEEQSFLIPPSSPQSSALTLEKEEEQSSLKCHSRTSEPLHPRRLTGYFPGCSSGSGSFKSSLALKRRCRGIIIVLGNPQSVTQSLLPSSAPRRRKAKRNLATPEEKEEEEDTNCVRGVIKWPTQPADRRTNPLRRS